MITHLAQASQRSHRARNCAQGILYARLADLCLARRSDLEIAEACSAIPLRAKSLPLLVGLADVRPSDTVDRDLRGCGDLVFSVAPKLAADLDTVDVEGRRCQELRCDQHLWNPFVF